MPKPLKKAVAPKVPKTITRRASGRIREAIKDPKLITPELEELADSLDKAHALDVMAQTEGARVLVDSLVSDIISTINSLANRYKTMSHTEMIAYCAELQANLGVLFAIRRAKPNRAALEESLAEALKT